jgi:hypothetical protein
MEKHQKEKEGKRTCTKDKEEQALNKTFLEISI